LTAFVEVRDDRVWDGATPFATLVPSGPSGAVSLQLTAPLVIGRDAAVAVVSALTGARVPVLDVGDELVRDAARRTGWTGALRGPLAAPAGAPAPADVAAAVQALLPGTTVTRRGFGRRTLSLRAVTTDGLRMKVKVPVRPDVVPELLAAALDVAFGVRRRFGRMASGVHTITIDDGAGAYDDHSTVGSAQSGTGTFFLDTSLACADAIDAQRRRLAGRAMVSARPARPWFAIDGVVAHEYWHNLDTTVVASPAVYLELNRGLGEELGVETFEHALRGREAGAPPAWRAALARIVTEVSPYATTNWREATAELFKLWWCRPLDGPSSPLVACFGALLDRFYPPPG
jgi:hypothetical protein